MASSISFLTALKLQRLKITTYSRLNVFKYLSNTYSTSQTTGEEIESGEQDEIERIRNVSRMPEHLRRELKGETFTYEGHVPYLASYVTPYKQRKIQRKFFGKYGKASNVDPAILWPSHRELDEIESREKEFFPSLQEMMANVEKEKLEKEEQDKLREEKVKENYSKLEGWVKDLEARKQRKLDEVRAQREKREKLIEDVRAHFGYRIDPKDERFKEMLQQKEKEERKALKEAKKKEKIAKQLARMNELAAKAQKTSEAKETNPESQSVDVKIENK